MNLFKNVGPWILIVVLVVGPWVLLNPETFGQRVIAFFISWVWLSVFMTWGWARFKAQEPRLGKPKTWESYGPEDISGWS